MTIKSKWAAAVFIVMALVLALGMAVVAAPVKNGGEAEAATQQWSGVLLPNPMTLGIMPGEDILQMELSPNFDTDNTIYAATFNTTTGTMQLRKSDNGGYWWETLGIGLGAGMPAPPWAVVDMAIAPDDPNYIVVVCSDGDPFSPWGGASPATSIIYASSDGGATFSPMGVLPIGVTAAGPATADEYVTSVDVSPLISGVHQIMAGVADNNVTIGAPFVSGEGVYIWGAGTPPMLTWAPQNLVWGEDVIKVAFSTNYYMDFTVVALSATVSSGAPPSVAGDTWVHLRDTSDNVAPFWDDIVVFPGWPAIGVALWDNATGAMSPDEAVLIQGNIALPDDFDATRAGKRVIYASTAGAFSLAVPYVDDAWRITAGTPWRLNVLGGGTVPISSLSHAGNISGGNLLAGVLGAGILGLGPDVYTCTTPYSGTPMWMSSSKPPTGLVNTQVRAAPDYLTSGVAFASTMGMAAWDESALSKCYDFGDTWNQIGLIDTDISGGVIDVAPVDAENVFFTSVCNPMGAVMPQMGASLWKSVPGGLVELSLWERVDMVPTFISPTPPTPPHSGMTGGVLLPIGSGAPDVELSPNYATDNTVYWVDAALGAGGGTLIRVSQDGGAYFATRNALTPISDFVVEDANTLYVVDAATATVYKSSDTGHTWPTTGVLPLAANIIEQEPSTGALAVSMAGGVIAICSDTTTHPLSFLPIGMIPAPGALQYIAHSNEYDSDGLIYVADSNGGVFRVAALAADQLDLTVALANLIGMPTGIAVTDDGTLYVSGFGVPVDNDADGVFNEDPIDGVDNDLDGVVDEDPPEGAAVWRTMNPTEDPVIPGVEPQWVALSWGIAPGSQLGGALLPLVPPVTPVTGLETCSSSNVLFSVNVGINFIGPPTAPMVIVQHSLMTFTDTLVTVVPSLVSPANGAITGVVEAIPVGTPRVRVDFEWSPVPDAHVYELQIDTDAGFHNPTIALITAPDTTVTNAGVLLTDMEYYWRVRVNQFITTAGTSPWSASWSFTTPVGTAAIAPEILGPEHGATDVRVEDPCFTWGSVTGATEYKFTLKDSAGTVLVDTTATETSYCYAGELEYETSYVWTVQGTSATTESGVAAATFSTEAEAEPTPAWVWIIIAIGAVVAIVVIVLIVRTRRPV